VAHAWLALVKATVFATAWLSRLIRSDQPGSILLVKCQSRLIAYPIDVKSMHATCPIHPIVSVRKRIMYLSAADAPLHDL